MRALVTVSMVLEVDEPELTFLVGQMEDAITANMREVFERHGLSQSEVDSVLEYFGATVTLKRGVVVP